MSSQLSHDATSFLPTPQMRHIDALTQYEERIRKNYFAMPVVNRLGLVVMNLNVKSQTWFAGFLPFEQCTIQQLMAYDVSEDAAYEILESLAACDVATEARVLIAEESPIACYSYLTVKF